MLSVVAFVCLLRQFRVRCVSCTVVTLWRWCEWKLKKRLGWPKVRDDYVTSSWQGFSKCKIQHKPTPCNAYRIMRRIMYIICVLPQSSMAWPIHLLFCLMIKSKNAFKMCSSISLQRLTLIKYQVIIYNCTMWFYVGRCGEEVRGNNISDAAEKCKLSV